MKIKLLLLIFFCLPVLLPAQDKKKDQLQLTSEPTSASFPLVHAGKTAVVYVDPKDAKVVRIAAEAFSKDVERVSGKLPDLKNTQSGIGEFPVIVGTLGSSDLIDRLAGKKTEIAAIKGQWETYSISVIDNP